MAGTLNLTALECSVNKVDITTTDATAANCVLITPATQDLATVSVISNAIKESPAFSQSADRASLVVATAHRLDYTINLSGHSLSASSTVRGLEVIGRETDLGTPNVEHIPFEVGNQSNPTWLKVFRPVGGVPSIRIGGASTHNIGFYGNAPIAQQTLSTGAGHTVDDVITALQNLGLVKQ